MITRRHFGKMALAGAGAFALGGSKLIRPGRVQAQNNEYYNAQIIDAAYNEMQNDAWIIDQQGLDGFNSIHWQHFLGAVYGTIGVLREHGLDQWMNEESPDQAWLAWQEGGWDPYWALMTIPIVGLMSDWLGDNFVNFQTNVTGNVWIYNNGPLSSQYEGIGGYAQLPPWPGDFQVYPDGMAMNPADDPIEESIRATIGPPDNIPWFDVWNAYLPNVVLGPLPTLIIWQSHQEKCKAMNDAIGGLQALAAIAAVKVKGMDDKAKIAIIIALYVLNAIKGRYC